MDVQAEGITNEELQLAARNHGMPLEALRLDVSPPGLHYVLVHYDVPFLDAAAHRLSVHGLVKWREKRFQRRRGLSILAGRQCIVNRLGLELASLLDGRQR